MTETPSPTEHIETGLNLVTAAVTPEPTQQALPLDTAPAPLPAGFSIQDAAALARDIAVNLDPLDATLQKHHVTEPQYKTLTGNAFFQRLLEGAVTEWNSGKSMPQRLALEAQVVVEGVLPSISARMRDAKEPLSSVVQALSAVTKVAGIGESKSAQPTGERFTITINLGADTLKYEKSRPTIEISPQSEGDASGGALPALPQA